MAEQRYDLWVTTKDFDYFRIEQCLTFDEVIKVYPTSRRLYPRHEGYSIHRKPHAEGNEDDGHQ